MAVPSASEYQRQGGSAATDLRAVALVLGAGAKGARTYTMLASRAPPRPPADMARRDGTKPSPIDDPPRCLFPHEPTRLRERARSPLGGNFTAAS